VSNGSPGFSPVLQIGLGLLLARSTANIGAVRAVVMGASDTGGCFSASPSRRYWTLWSWPTSLRIASIAKPWVPRALVEKPKMGRLR
jgi:hypothetical protein